MTNESNAADEFTKAERVAINAAFNALSYLCDSTNWSDPVALRDAVKLERREMGDTLSARAMVCKAWFEGLGSPDKPAREFYWVRPGYLAAFLLGVRHACERMNSDYTSSLVERARDLCPAVIEAKDAQTTRRT